MKRLTLELDNELFLLHSQVWDNGDIRLSRLTAYAQKVSELYREGYAVTDHIRFCSYYRNMAYYKACNKLERVVRENGCECRNSSL